MAINNSFTGTFGTGNVSFYAGRVISTPTVSTFIVPQSISTVRVRVWGAGATGSYGGSAGGFAMKTIYGLTPGSSIVVTAGNSWTSPGGTSSFGSYVSATGGTGQPTGGTGVGGDINYVGGSGGTYGGGGAANVFGSGSNAVSSNSRAASGVSGAGSDAAAPTSQAAGGSGLFGVGATYVPYTSGIGITPAASGLTANEFNLDAIGAGGGGAYYMAGQNGGGGGYVASGGFPAGGGGYNGYGGAGLVIVEW